jgi:hypothetical protein
VLTYAARAVPWLRVGGALALVGLLLQLVRWDPWLLWPLQGTAVGLLAGATAWCFDEQAAAVVDASPRGLAWRTAARAPAVLLLVLVWVLLVAHAREALFGHALAVALQGVVAVAASAAWTLWRRAAGEGTPGTRTATTVVPLVTTWALVRPFEQQLPVFPYATDGAYGDWRTSVVAWLCVGAAAAVLLTLAVTEVAWWRPRRTPGRPLDGEPSELTQPEFVALRSGEAEALFKGA